MGQAGLIFADMGSYSGPITSKPLGRGEKKVINKHPEGEHREKCLRRTTVMCRGGGEWVMDPHLGR